MTIQQLFSLLASVLTHPAVIGVTVVLAIYVNIVFYVVYYRKRVPQPKQKRAKPATPTPETQEGEGEKEAKPAKPGRKKGGKQAKEEASEDEETVE